METNSTTINIADLPDDISGIDENAIIILDDKDELADDTFWEQ